jgi:zinc protease
VSADDVQKFAATKIDVKGANVILVGNAKVFLADLQKQFPNVEVIPLTELDLNNANLRKSQAMKAAK